MNKIQTEIDWYNLTKDIIIPLLGVISTVIIGIVIAMLLKSKEEKAKIKMLLIDNYMLFLNTRLNDVKKETLNLTQTILTEFVREYSSHFEPNANRHITIEQIKKRIKELNLKNSAIDSDDSNWSLFTYKFCFLLGKKSYFKHLLQLENEITNEYLSREGFESLSKGIKGDLLANPKISTCLKSSNNYEIDEGLDIIEGNVAKSFNSFQFKYFNEYTVKLAEMINKY